MKYLFTLLLLGGCCSLPDKCCNAKLSDPKFHYGDLVKSDHFYVCTGNIIDIDIRTDENLNLYYRYRVKGKCNGVMEEEEVSVSEEYLTFIKSGETKCKQY